MKSNSFKEYIMPSLVLVVICLCISSALVFTNKATKPTIDKIAKEKADSVRAKVLSEADSFKQFEGKLNDGITEYYSATNGSGVVITSQSKSFGGTMTVMVGINNSGAITGVEVTNHADTPGLGTKAMTPEYLSKYKNIGELAAENIKDEKSVDHIVGASISSNGVYSAVRNALIQYKDAGGVQ